jgi:hypothetical protein
MDMSSWIALDFNQIAPATVPADAPWATESPSLNDVPTHARSGYDSATGIFTIEFRYLYDEEKSPFEVTAYIRVLSGRKSHRLYRIDFDIHGFNRDRNRIAQQTKSSLASCTKIVEPNRDIAIRIIDEEQAKLFSKIPSSTTSSEKSAHHL